MVFQVRIYDRGGKPIYRSLWQKSPDRESAGVYAEELCGVMGGDHWEIFEFMGA